jgi:hypothetical protein
MYDVQVVVTGEPPHASTGRPEPLAPEIPTDGQPLPAFDVYSTAGTSSHFALDLPVTLIGRHPACNLRFLEEVVAYFQCAIVKTQGGIWCIDVLSPRGTVLNGRATRLAQLRDGDLIELGKMSLVLRLGPPTESHVTVFAPGQMRPAPSETADTIGAILTPVREMMEQFQQCFMTMARMFTTMQQEHTAMMCEQMRQVQELLRESRETPSKASTPPVALPTATPPTPPAPPPATPSSSTTPKAPSPKLSEPEEARQLSDAHSWFLDRLNQNGTSTAKKPKPN